MSINSLKFVKIIKNMPGNDSLSYRWKFQGSTNNIFWIQTNN